MKTGQLYCVVGLVYLQAVFHLFGFQIVLEMQELRWFAPLILLVWATILQILSLILIRTSNIKILMQSAYIGSRCNG